MKQIERITKMEKILDTSNAVAQSLLQALTEFEENIPEYNLLVSYYESSEWKNDFEDDEKGLLPKDLKRGVLSEDGIYNLIETNQEIYDLMEKILEIKNDTTA
ncbi:MAG: DUF4298 domain-containing protein [Solobacterium sp.]|nr:DUF4298 domain-containing protein [Solobacterium sp.]